MMFFLKKITHNIIKKKTGDLIWKNGNANCAATSTILKLEMKSGK